MCHVYYYQKNPGQVAFFQAEADLINQRIRKLTRAKALVNKRLKQVARKKI